MTCATNWGWKQSDWQRCELLTTQQQCCAWRHDDVGRGARGDDVSYWCWVPWCFPLQHASRLVGSQSGLKCAPTSIGWLRDTVVERRFLTGELSLSCARPAADGWPLNLYVGKPSAVGQPTKLTQPFILSG